jgi:hypothetical protein
MTDEQYKEKTLAEIKEAVACRLFQKAANDEILLEAWECGWHTGFQAAGKRNNNLAGQADKDCSVEGVVEDRVTGRFSYWADAVQQ